MTVEHARELTPDGTRRGGVRGRARVAAWRCRTRSRHNDSGGTSGSPRLRRIAGGDHSRDGGGVTRSRRCRCCVSTSGAPGGRRCSTSSAPRAAACCSASRCSTRWRCGGSVSTRRHSRRCSCSRRSSSPCSSSTGQEGSARPRTSGSATRSRTRSRRWPSGVLLVAGVLVLLREIRHRHAAARRAREDRVRGAAVLSRHRCRHPLPAPRTHRRGRGRGDDDGDGDGRRRRARDQCHGGRRRSQRRRSRVRRVEHRTDRRDRRRSTPSSARVGSSRSSSSRSCRRTRSCSSPGSPIRRVATRSAASSSDRSPRRSCPTWWRSDVPL